MQKPTSSLNFEIIQFLRGESQVINLLNARDSDNGTVGVELRCAFYKSHPTMPNLSAFRVDFIYNTKYPAMEKNDDIFVIVEVKQGNPPQFRVVDLKTY